MSYALPVLAEVRRGPLVESWHRGVIVISEPDGGLVLNYGDADLVTSTRSTIKPIQALPLITSGAADHYQLGPRELAAACASHEGEPIHTETAAAMLARVGLDESALRCGAHAPYNPETAKQLERDGQPFNQLHNNCSGKHAGMLVTAVHRGLEVEDYIAPTHPVQLGIVKALSRLGDLPEDLPTAIDGCSAPTYGVTVRSLATAAARLANACCEDAARVVLEPELAAAARRLVKAMIAHPEMVGGTKGRFDTDLMRAARGKLFAKVGAEAVYSVGVLPSDRYPRGLGLSFKMEDGSYRGLAPAVVETLRQIGVLDEAEAMQLTTYYRPVLENRRGLLVGEVAAVFDLGFNKQ
ncbi:MAG TPA: asparaginase [Blastocatellia bacterium]|nr:asparaginase [Blastocatellia bacterium]